jgi:aspartyl protease family protein
VICVTVSAHFLFSVKPETQKNTGMKILKVLLKSISLALFTSTAVLAVEVELAGVFGKRAVLVIYGGAPQTLSAGQYSREGVRLLEVNSAAAVVDVVGERRRLTMGEAPLRIIEPVAQQSGAATLRLVPDIHGHYWAQGAVNSASLRFMIDTGATYVAISADEAKRAGIDYRSGQRVRMNTANGPSNAWLVTLDRVSIGGVVLHGIQGSVHEQGLPVALLGMSFLNRLDMRREAGDLLLARRY